MKNLYRLKIIKIGCVGIGSFFLIFILLFLLFSDTFISSFLKNQIKKTFTFSYPADSLMLGNLHYKVWSNSLECDSVTMISGEYACCIKQLSVSGINWIKILRNKDSALDAFRNAVINVRDANLTFRKSLNELNFRKLHLSVPDSEVAVYSIKYYSLNKDEIFFAKSKFRQTRFLFDISSLSITGLDCLNMFRGNIYKAKCINIYGLFTDILVNMDKPYDNNSSNPKMPNEFLASIKDIISIDSLNIYKGRLNYSERFEIKAKPGIVTFNDVNFCITNISNHSVQPVTSIIKGDGIFLNSGRMKLFMKIPINAEDFSLRYSGSLSPMDGSRLNSFIEPGEHHRIKSGIIKFADFNINVINGHAEGKVSMVYKDLYIAVLNKNTGSENGIIDRVSSLFGRIFVIRGSNLPDKNGKIKIGATKYSRKPDDYFFQYIWFALRNGIGDVVGFPPR